jgi:hypothetical protein
MGDVAGSGFAKSSPGVADEIVDVVTSSFVVIRVAIEVVLIPTNVDTFSTEPTSTHFVEAIGRGKVCHKMKLELTALGSGVALSQGW